MNKKKLFPRTIVKKTKGFNSKSARISAFERGLVTWIDESYNPDSYLEGRVIASDSDNVSFDD